MMQCYTEKECQVMGLACRVAVLVSFRRIKWFDCAVESSNGDQVVGGAG